MTNTMIISNIIGNNMYSYDNAYGIFLGRNFKLARTYQKYDENKMKNWFFTSMDIERDDYHFEKRMVDLHHYDNHTFYFTKDTLPMRYEVHFGFEFEHDLLMFKMKF